MRLQLFGGGELGSYLVKSYLVPYPNPAARVDRAFLGSQNRSHLHDIDATVASFSQESVIASETSRAPLRRSYLQEHGIFVSRQKWSLTLLRFRVFYYNSFCRFNYSLIMQKGTQPDLFFIRHGQSTKNQAAHAYRMERNLPFDWDLFMKDPQFVRGVIYNPKHIDCHLSQKGRLQCAQASEKLKDLNPQIILVSPLQRALETCSLIFPNNQVPRVVQPLLSETFKHSSDICRSLELKKKDFPQFDFSRVDSEGQFWFIKNDSLENQAKYFQFLAEVQSEYYHEKAESIMNFMHRENIQEKPLNIRLRASKIKQLLKQYRKKFSRIAIVSHFYTIQYLCSKNFDQNDEPIDEIHMKNCGVLPITLSEIEQISKE